MTQMTRHNRWPDVLPLLALAPVAIPAGLALGSKPLGLFLAVAALVPLWWRRQHADAVLAWLTVLAGAQLLATDSPSAINLTYLVGLYSVARHGTQRFRWVWPTVAVLGALVGALDWTKDEIGLVSTAVYAGDLAIAFVLAAALALLAWGAGRYVGQWRSLQRSRADAESQRLRLAVAAERSDLARDVHDVIGHSLALIAVRAESARYLAEAGDEVELTPEEKLAEASRALADIRVTARAALDDTRSLAAMFRSAARADEAPDEPAHAPAPSLADIPALVERWQATAHRVDFAQSDDLPALSGPAGVAAYRVVQEGLTNIAKHAPGATSVTVTVVGAPEAVEIRVANDGATAPADGAGTGLAGLRERVEAVGGRFSAGPSAGDRFEVYAHLPARTENPA